ncbi:TolC family protein [Candidatus Deferrimicrobium sp.]|uniref:TolC family protein n=1 Tax=Candidatus Deferrimicrobium sp. TaxID=3060586 RepID=UPI002728B332|nr:TolC family protein [Candidatus Deferrimicrobium sp.]MDO8739262.1 TolC family protein [Candidatus Deferrimicrobium sp.]
MKRRAWIPPVAALITLSAIVSGALAADNTAVPPAGTAPASVTWTIDQVADIALRNHPLVRQSDAETAAAAARKGQAESPWYPSVILSTGYSRTRSFSVQSEKSLTAPNEFLRGDLSVLLTDFGRTSASVNRSDALLSATRETGVTVREDVAYAAKVGYFNVLRAGRNLEVKRETLRQRESLLKQAEAFFEAGIRAKIEVARTEANLYDARAQLSQAENDVRVARITLLNRMGVEGPANFLLSDSLAAETIPGTVPDWIAEAERNRPELKTLRERERAAAQAVRFARGGYFPVLAGAAGFGYGGDEAPLDQNYTVGVTLSVPLFSGFLTREQVKEAEASLSSVRHELTDVRRRVLLQVEQAAYGASEASERIGARKKEREASDENLRLATARYEVGVGSIIEMIDAQVQMTQADTATIDAQYDYSVSVATLLRAVGR